MEYKYFEIDDCHIGSNIYFWRKYRRLTQTELADALGVTRLTIVNFEKNKTKNIKQQHITKFAKILRVPEFVLTYRTNYHKILTAISKKHSLLDQEIFDLCLINISKMQTLNANFFELIVMLLKANSSYFFTQNTSSLDEESITLRYKSLVEEFAITNQLSEAEAGDLNTVQIRYTGLININFIGFVYNTLKTNPSRFIIETDKLC